MATSQTAADKKKVGMLGERDAGGFVYTSIGSCDFYTGEGSPDHAARKGSIYVDVDGAEAYICTVASGTWVLIGSQS
jgi:hypothetical protein